METKICTKCGENKSLDEYYRHAKYKDGRQSECKSCIIDRNKKYCKTEKGELVKVKAQVKYYKSDKGKLKIVEYKKSDKGKAVIAKAGAKYAKSDKGKVVQTRYRKSDKGKSMRAKHMKTDKGRVTASRSRHNRRTKEKENIKDFTDKIYNYILHDCQSNKCACCGRTFNNKLKPTLDHINPVSKGGPLIKENVQFLCMKDNGEKSIKYIDYRTDAHKNMIKTI
jgi:hypothetical protein